ncbi:MAG: hypothetical protein IKX68_10425 [Clostridiales bacterium]|nr:hypothetical protein [Clostridiales bacterium]
MDSTAKHDGKVLAGLVLIFVAFASIIPDIGFRITTMGFVWTLYRFVIPASLVFAFVLCEGKSLVKKSSMTFYMTMFMGFWVIYGIALLLISRYSDKHAGFIELLALANGFFVFVIIGMIGITEDGFQKISKAIVFSLNALLVLAFFEIITARHLPTSFFYDTKANAYNGISPHAATGFLYNVNDFSAMITCLFPVVLVCWRSKLRWITILAIMAVNMVNDSTSCNLAIIACLMFYFITNDKIGQGRRFIRKALVIGVALVGAFIVLFGQSILGGRNDILGALSRQVTNLKNSNGSLWKRVTIYKDSVSAFIGSKGIGLGPSSFTPYFTKHPSASNLANPHAVLVEILFEYGIIIFVWYVGMMVAIFKKALHCYNSDKNRDNKKQFMMIMMIVIVYIFVGFAPSAFLGYAYQWLILALCCIRLDITKNRRIEYA